MADSLVITLFFLSGASSLIYEVLWVRMFTQVFGNTMAATSTVLSAFMAGLALGSYLIGSYADRHPRNSLKLYAYLEGMIGIFGLLMPTLVQALYFVYGWLFTNFQDSYHLMGLSRFALSFFVILIPTSLMGATLPVLTRHFVFSHRVLCRWVGLLYGTNALGAVAGSFVSGFFLIAWLGVTHTIYAAAAINFAIAVFALVLGGIGYASERAASSLSGAKISVPREPVATGGVRIRRLLLVVCFGSGFSALAYEVIWVRLLVFVLDSTVYAFCTMLTVFLFGIAFGGFLISSVGGKIGNHLRWLGMLETLIGLSGFATIIVISNLVGIDAGLRKAISQFSYGGWWTVNILKFIEAFSIMLVPTTLMGMALPLICRIYTKSIKELGGSIGAVYAMNTFGAVLGSLAAGFVMIPLLGIVRSIVVASAVGVILGSMVLLASARRTVARGWLFNTAVVATGLCAALVWVSPDAFSDVYNMPERGSRLVYYHEGKSGTVTIHLYPLDERVISVNGTNVAGTQFSLRTTQKLQAHIPMLVHGHARRVLQIGFGSGESCHVLSLYPVERIDLVEIDRNVIRASDKFFRDLNQGVTEHPAFRAIIMDGKNYALLTDEKYDVIMNDSTFPGKSGSSSLYTRDHFLACRRLLNEGGVMSSWVPFEIKSRDFKNIVKTFQSVFPQTTLWLANNCRNKHALIVGTVKPFEVDFDRVVELMDMPSVKADLEEVRLSNPYALLGSLALSPASVERYSYLAPINSDDHPTLEFSAGRYPTRTAYWAANHADFLQFRSSIIPYMRFSETDGDQSNIVRKTMMRYESANIHVDKARLFELTDEAQGIFKMFRMLTLEQREEYEKALRINPDDANARAFLAEGDASLLALEQLAGREPENPKVLFHLGRAYRGQRRYRAAIDALAKAANLDGGNSLYQDALRQTLDEFRDAGAMNSDGLRLQVSATN
jgi:spermidine synthase